MPLKTLFFYYWPLLSIAIVAVLFRLIHNTRAVVRALENRCRIPPTVGVKGMKRIRAKRRKGGT